MRRLFGFVLGIALFAAPAFADPCEARVRLRDGKLATADLARVLLDNFHLKGGERDAGDIDLSGLRGATFVQALNASLGEGCNVRVDDEALVLHVDPEKLPRNLTALKQSVRLFTAKAAPDATAKQRAQYGLFLPPHVDAGREMVVLVHGLDCNRSNWFPMADLLIGEGFQVAYFTYPSDGPLEESAAMLTEEMITLRAKFPQLRTHVLAHSMGGLVARRYVEGDGYAGGVERLILIGTPSQGSRWATYRIALEAQEHWALWRQEKDWSPSWIITDGLGEAGRDLKPTSAFLKELNDRPRRGGVAYTVIAGAQHPVYPIGANALDGCANAIPDRAAKWWGFRQTDRFLHARAEKLRQKQGKSDGPVTIKSTKLEGVEDHVVLSADHTGLYYPVDGKKPAAWEIIRERLKTK